MEGLYYLCSENKGADQLHNYYASGLRLCFRICKKACFLKKVKLFEPLYSKADNCANAPMHSPGLIRVVSVRLLNG